MIKRENGDIPTQCSALLKIEPMEKKRDTIFSGRDMLSSSSEM